ncbi:MAG TPA: hypothetical protein VF092_23900 [Longimicrobium sp.]
MQDDRETRASSPADAPDASKDERGDAAPKPAVRVETTPEDEEMGGEQPCQLHRFWDVPEE